MVGDALGVVAGRYRDHTSNWTLRLKPNQLVQCAAFFEGRGELLVFELYPNLRAGDRGERLTLLARRVEDGAINHRRGLPNIIESRPHSAKSKGPREGGFAGGPEWRWARGRKSFASWSWLSAGTSKPEPCPGDDGSRGLRLAGGPH